MFIKTDQFIWIVANSIYFAKKHSLTISYTIEICFIWNKSHINNWITHGFLYENAHYSALEKDFQCHADFNEVSPRLEISLNQMSNPEVLYFSEKQTLSDAISANDSIIVRHTRRTDVLFVHRSTFGYTIGMLWRHGSLWHCSIVGRFWCSMYENDW